MSKIQCLSQEIIDRIAAGEVVQRPCSIVKELIENSLDAEASTVEVTSVGGGLESLTIQDNGTGMSKEDLSLAATRFATSKLQTFSDLKSIRTFGFRGEALASASMVSRLSIQTKRGEDVIASKASYTDGVLQPPLKSQAGTVGTIVTISDLFYNIPSRKRSFKKLSDEYTKTLDVCQKYAVHEAGTGVGFICKKRAVEGKSKTQNSTDLNTSSLVAIKQIQQKKAKAKAQDVDSVDAVNARKEAISNIYGSDLSRELLVFESSEGDIEEVSLVALQQLQGMDKLDSVNAKKISQFAFAYKAKGLITNGSYNASKCSTNLIIFINGRLVSSSAVKNAIDSVYNDILPSRGKSFVYLSLELPGPHVDVNVHPTKKEIAFLHEDKLCDTLATEIRKCLLSATASRTFYAQQVLGTAREKEAVEVEKSQQKQQQQLQIKRKATSDLPPPPSKSSSSLSKPGAAAKAYYNPSKLVRTNAAAPVGALEPFLSQATQSTKNGGTNINSNGNGDNSFYVPQEHVASCKIEAAAKIDMSAPGAFAALLKCDCPPISDYAISKAQQQQNAVTRPKKIIPTPCSYGSVQALRADIATRVDKELLDKLRISTFVGSVSRHRSLIQSSVEMIMINHYELAKELFYQVAVWKFGGFQVAVLPNKLGIAKLIKGCLEKEGLDGDKNVGAPIAEVTASMTKTLVDSREMLEEYFSIRIDKNGMLGALPVLLENHVPSVCHLPRFLVKLATEVDYENEKSCFESICSEIGVYYAELSDDIGGGDGAEGDNISLIDDEARKLVQHTLFPNIAFCLQPPKEFASDGTFTLCALLPSLYRVFERC